MISGYLLKVFSSQGVLLNGEVLIEMSGVAKNVPPVVLDITEWLKMMGINLFKWCVKGNIFIYGKPMQTLMQLKELFFDLYHLGFSI